MMNRNMTRRPLPCFVALALLSLSLSACGGGGSSNVRPTPPPQDPCMVNPDAAGCQPDNPPDNDPPPADDSGNGNGNGSGDSDGSGSYSPQQSQLIPTHVTDAHDEGFTGQGVKVGILGSGADRQLASLKGHVDGYTIYLPTDQADPSVDDAFGHGSAVAQILGGSAADGFPGGVAPDAGLYVARVADDANGMTYMSKVDAAYTDMLNEGVRLVNNSYGDTTSVTMLPTSAASPGSSAYREYQIFDKVVQAGGLMVWAASNDSYTDPSIEAGLPYLFPGLEPGWLAVVNVTIGADGQPGDLDPTSNACGVAARWCLAAPGDDYFLPVPGTEYDTGHADGTSLSAPVVTGVAALVWQAYPWMSADNVRQTVLTTATHLGDGPADQPNATFGWGMVNAEKAVHGPGQFAFGDFVADVGDDNATFANPIGGDGGLVVQGDTGTLTLTADNTYTGATRIESGALVLTGSITSNVTVAADLASLTGDGTIHGDLVNQHIVQSVSAQAGHGLTVDGNYTAGANAQTLIGIGNPLTVGGTASLDGGLTLMSAPKDYTPKTTETLVDAGDVKGAFATFQVDGSVMYTGTLAYDTQHVTVTLARADVSALAAQAMPASATDVQQTASHVEQALTQADQWAATSTTSTAHDAFLSAASRFLSAAAVPVAQASLTSLSGEIHASSQAQVFQQGAIVSRTLADRVAAVDQAPDGAGVWMQATGASGDLARAGFASGRYDSSGAMVGADITANGLVGGIALGRHRLTGDYDALAGRSKDRDTSVSLYGRASLHHGNYLSARVGQDWIDVDVTRQALLGGSLERIASHRRDRLQSAYLEAGHVWQGASVRWTPFAGVSFNRLERDAIAERGAGGFGLAADAHSYRQWSGTLGLRMDASWSWSGGDSTLRGYALWRHVASGTDLGFEAAYAGAPQAGFHVEGIDTRANQWWMGVGLNTRVNRHWGWFVNADMEQAGAGNHAAILSAGVRVHL